MDWLVLAASAVTASVPGGDPAGVTLEDVLAREILGYGVLGIVAIVLSWVLYKGKFVQKERADEMVTAARADLLDERARLLAELAKAQEQRDAALSIAQERLVPLLTSFVATSSSLIPLLQELVNRRERP